MAEEAEHAAIAFLLRLDPATQREVLKRYEEALQVELDTDSRRLRRIAVALHQTSRTLGRSPSLREYKALRESQPERGWPDPRSITRWLGVRSWSDALVRMRLEPVLEGDAIEGAIGPTYSIEEVTQAVRDCTEDLGRPPTITEYLAWQRRPDVRERPGRRPASTWVFNRIFGGFPQARVAAGLIEGELTAAHPSELILRTANYRLSTEQILTDLRDVAARVSERVTATVYDRERRLIYQETKAVGRPRALAGVGSVYRHFGSWVAALKEAGIDSNKRIAVTTRLAVSSLAVSSLRISDEELLHALAEAHAAVTGLLTIQRYMAWRQRQLVGDAPHGNVPGYTTIYRRFGSWRAALQAAGIHRETVTGHKNGPPFETAQFAGTTEGRQKILQALGEAHAATAGALTVQRYSTWREQQLARGTYWRDELPASTTIYRCFGSFWAALRAAGLDVFRTGRAEGVRYSNEQLLRFLHEADHATDGRLTIGQYLAWREEQSAGDRALRTSLPASATIIQRFGSWTKAVEQIQRRKGTE